MHVAARTVVITIDFIRNIIFAPGESFKLSCEQGIVGVGETDGSIKEKLNRGVVTCKVRFS